MLALCSPLQAARLGGAEHVLEVGGDAAMGLGARFVVNAAGLWAPGLAARCAGLPAAHVPTAHHAKGNYFSLSGRSPFSRLIYPMPEKAGLGVHLTLDLAGQARFGPDVQWLPDGPPDELDYSVDPARGDVFYAAIRSYWPGLPDGALQPAYSGVRPQAAPSGRTSQRLRDPGPGRTRRGRARQPVRHRVARADREPRDRRRRAGQTRDRALRRLRTRAPTDVANVRRSTVRAGRTGPCRPSSRSGRSSSQGRRAAASARASARSAT